MSDLERNEPTDPTTALEIETPSGPPRWRPIVADAHAPVGPVPESSGPLPERRRELRLGVHLRVRTTSVDPVLDRTTRSRCYQTSEDDAVLDLSRRGARLRCARLPAIGTRLLLGFLLPGDALAVELIACVRWARTEFIPGDHGARAVAAVGVEIVGGSERALTRFESALAELERRDPRARSALATPFSLG
jgi:hypothetical protein